MNIKCAKCGQEYEVGAECFGRTVECQCGAKMTVPSGNPEPLPNVRFKSSGHAAPVAAAGKPKAADKNTEAFVVPKIAKWLYEIGKLVVALGIVMTVFAIIGVCADGAKKLVYLPLTASAIIPGVLMMGGGKALEYLAEIAFNTRKR